MAMHMLMKRGKRTVAKYFKDEGCKQQQFVQQQLNDFICYLLDPKKPIDDLETLDWCRWLVAGGVTFEEFSKEVRRYNNAVTCGLVWTANFVAYRCRTCGISPCMSLCADCFQASDHTGHDFNMFRSQAGGACDCGDINVMKPEGFCPRHGPEHTNQLPSCPADLLTVAESIMPKLVFRLVQHLRDNSRPDMLDTFLVAMNDAEEYVAFLHTLSDMGAAMRAIMTRVVTNPQLYKQLTTVTTGEEYQEQNQTNYQAALDSLKSPPVPDEFLEIGGINTPLNHETLLEELVFWTVKFEFPQKIVTLLLSILPDENYKEAFTCAFIKHYSRVSVALVNSIDRQTISNRVVHVSVQLLSPERLATKMVRDYHLLHIMLASLDHMMRCILIDSGLNDPRDNFHMVVDCEKDTLREHCYWPIVSDLINVLSHKPVAQAFLINETLLDFWFGLVGYFQGMNLNLRQMVQHVEYEPDTYYAAFSAELEICSSPMWSLLVHCNGEGSEEYTRAVIRAATAALQDWFVAVNVSPGSIPNPLQISFHLPLHRYLAVFLSQAVRVQGLDITELLPSHNYLQMLMIHPLQLQVVFQEIFCGMWVRNGLQIKGQAMTYIQCHFCNSMVDADLYLLQVCAANLDPDYFTKTVLERFHVRDLLTFVPVDKRGQRKLVQTEHEMPMLEGALSLLTMLLSISSRLGMTESDLTGLEMLTLLCMSDRTHSQLMDLMPEKCGLTGHAKDFEPTLKDIADYRAPNFEAGGAMQQGMYMPKGHIWQDHYDPLYVLLRAMHRKDFQQSLDRYATYMRNTGLYNSKSSPWPPFRLPGAIHPAYAGLRRLLHCRTMHGLIFTLLYKGVHEQNLPDAILYFSVFLLEMALTVPSPSHTNSEIQIPPRPRDKHFSEWFPTSNILGNLCHQVGEIMVTVEEVLPPSPSSAGLSLIEPPSLINLFSPVPSTLSVSGGLLASFGGGTNIQHAITAATPNTTTTATTQTQTAEISAAEIITNTIQDLLNQVSEQMPTAAEPDPALVAPPTISMATASTSTTGTSMNTSAGTSPSTSMGTSMETDASTSSDAGTSTSTGTSTASARQFTSQGVTADLDRQRRTFPVRVDENMISLLVKLFHKLGGQNYVPPPHRQEASTSESESSAQKCRVGDGPYYIGRVLDLAYQGHLECANVIEAIYRDCQPKASTDGAQGKKDTSDLEDRRKRARERQKKLMEQFASKQKQFMEKIIGESGESEAAEELRRSMSEDPPSMNLTMEETYDCCICNQTTPSTEDRPLGLVTLLQPTSVLGQRQHMGGPMQLPLGDAVARHPRNNCAEFMEQRFKHLTRHCEETSCLLSVNIGWQGGVFAQTCGHYVHLDCHTSYMDSLKTQQVTSLQVSRGEYWCPLCRQLANTALPIAPDVGPAVVKPLPKTQRDLVIHIGVTMEQRQMTPTTILTTAMGNVMENLTTATYPKYKTCSKTHSAESVLLFVCSVLRTNLELELEQRAGKLIPLTKPSSKRVCLVPLMQVLSMHSNFLTTKPYTEVWFHLTGVPIHPQHTSDSVAVYTEQVSLMLKDPSALLIQLVLTMPITIDREAYTCIVKAIYNLVYIQALAVVSCRFCDEERIAWKSKAKEAGFGSLGGLLAHVILHLSQSSFYEDGTPVDPHIPALTHSVWSPQCVESTVEEMCVPYLRMAALLQQHLYPESSADDATETEAVSEYLALCEYLQLVAPPVDASQRSSADAVHWFCESPQALVVSWAQHFSQFATKHSTTARTLLTMPVQWQAPSLFMLPRRYDVIFQHYRKRACPNCSSVPKDPALCLVCAGLVCFKETCCRQQNISEAVQHAIDCGGGTGMFLIVNSSMIVVISGRRATLWGSVYLDEHGEEDRELKRGKPLYLSEERYKLLQQQWIQHTFEHVCKRWIFHQNRL